MENNKVPIWENYKNYLPEVKFLVECLLAISDRDFQVRVWANASGPEVDWYAECMLTFNDRIDYFKTLLKEKNLHLNAEQIKAILRVYVMGVCFERRLDPKKIPKEWTASEMYIINHPYWEKVRKQAQRALQLLEKPHIQHDKSVRLSEH